jgi:hypothetical protein
MRRQASRPRCEHRIACSWPLAPCSVVWPEPDQAAYGHAVIGREAGYPPGDMIRASAFLVAFIAASACGSTSPGDGAANGDDASLGGADANLGDGDDNLEDDDAGDGGSDGEASTACASSLAAFCASPPPGEPCAPALLPVYLDAACVGGTRSLFVTSCGGFDELILEGIDFSVTRYYDPTSEQLVAIVEYSANFGGSTSCVAGPPGFVAPSCPGATSQPACPLFDGSLSKFDMPDAGDGSSGEAGGLDP